MAVSYLQSPVPQGETPAPYCDLPAGICHAHNPGGSRNKQFVNDPVILINPLVVSFTPPQQKGKVRMKNRTSRKSGFTLVEIMIVVAIIGLLAAIAIPNFVRARTTSQMNACINNLRQIDGAKQQWALETKQSTNATPVITDVSPYLRNSVLCPAAGAATTFTASYTMGDVSTKPLCVILPGTHKLPLDTTN